MKYGIVTATVASCLGFALLQADETAGFALDGMELGFTTLFPDEAVEVTMSLGANGGFTELFYRASAGDDALASGTWDLTTTNYGEPDKVSFDVEVSTTGTVEIVVEVSSDASFPEATTQTASAAAQVIQPGVSLVPLVVILVVAMSTQMVEVALGSGIFVGGMIVTGSVMDGFTRSLDVYILDAVYNVGHVYVVLFTLFLSGLVGVMQKAGGIYGFSELMLKYAKTVRSAQLVGIFSGMLIFFDDYANCLVVGASMLPLFDPLSISREKLAFIVDATAAPIASVVPISSWVGFEIGLIQSELDSISALNDGVYPEGLSGGSGFLVFVRSIPGRHYPIYMLVLQIFLVLSKRDFGPMLAAERKCRVFGRTDGGDGAAKGGKHLVDVNKPIEGTPRKAYNFFFPLGMLVFLILYVMVAGGRRNSEDRNDIVEIFSNSDSYAALLYGTMGTSLITLIFYSLQFYKGETIAAPTKASCLGKETDESEDAVKALISPAECVNSWLRGLTKVFPAIIVLTLAWAVGSLMTDVGADRLFAKAITEGGIDPGNLPSITFILSALIALATGTSWGTMGIMFPLVVKSSFIASDGNADIVIAVIAAILAGAVAGDHMSPISDTTVLSSLATDCDLNRHVITQLPYAVVVSIWAVLVGTLPVGAWAVGGSGYSPAVSILMGFIFIGLTVATLGTPVLIKSGRFDPLTELYMMVYKGSDLHELKKATAEFTISGESTSKVSGDTGGPVAETAVVIDA